VWAFAFSAKASVGVSARVTARIVYLDSTGGVLATHNGTQITLDGTFRQISVSAPAAPANTSKIQAEMRFSNSDTSSNTVHLKNAQAEKASSPSLFRVGEESVENDPSVSRGRAIPVYNPGDAPAPIRLEMEGTSVAEFAAGILDSRADSDYLNTRKVFQCESGTLGADTTATTDANASPGSGNTVAETTFATDNNLVVRYSNPSTTTLLDCYRGGMFLVYLRARGTGAAAADEFEIQLKWGINQSQDVANPLPALRFKPGTNADFYDLPLGTVQYPDITTLFAVNFYVFARRLGGTGNLRLDHIALAPATDLGHVEALQDASAIFGVGVSDPERGIAYMKVSGSQGRLLGVRGALPAYAPPGLSVLYLHLADLTNPKIDSRRKTVLTRDAKMRPYLAPRYRQ
jgi:hypothetical protein